MSFPSLEREQMSTDLPHDVIFMCILPRLSYKSLSRFKCVSKTWHKTISKDTRFARDQSICASPSSCGVVFSCCKGNKIELFETFGSPIGINPRHHLFANPGVIFLRVMASSSGLVCILLKHSKTLNGGRSIYIGNLATEEVGDTIPARGLGAEVIGLAFDPLVKPNSYKLVHPIWIPDFSNSYEFEVYSSDRCRGGWVRSSKRVYVGTSLRQAGKSIALKNVLYFDGYEYVISFDPWNDVANYIELPMQKSESYHCQELGTCGGSITCTRITDNRYMQVYFLFEREKRWESRYGVDLGMLIDANPYVFQESFDKLRLDLSYPFPYDGSPRLFFRIHKDEVELVFSYDPKSKIVQLCSSTVRRIRHVIYMYHNSMAALHSK